MVFGLFKKKQTADTIFKNGKIYTQDADFPWTDAVACLEGEIICVGDDENAEELCGSDTQVIDLEGKHMFPGFINTHSHPARRLFEGEYYELSDKWDRETLFGNVADYVSGNMLLDAYFGYGFNAHVLEGMEPEEARAKLDEISEDKPIVLLSRDESSIWVNNAALQAVTQAAQEDGVRNITVDYLLSALELIDFENMQEKMKDLVSEYCRRGFTSIVNAGAPEFMNSIYQELVVQLHQQDMLKQRNFGSLEISRDISPDTVLGRLMHKKTDTMEMDDFVTCDLLKVVLGREEIQAGPDLENLVKTFKLVSERGFCIMAEPLDKTAFRECIEAVSAVRDAGYRKNEIIICCEKDLKAEDEDFSLDEYSLDNVRFAPSANREASNEYAAVEGLGRVEEIIERFTIDAALSIGKEESLGSVEAGKRADFVIFDENPFELANAGLFRKLEASAVVLDGKVVYDDNEDNMQEWYDLMVGMHM